MDLTPVNNKYYPIRDKVDGGQLYKKSSKSGKLMKRDGCYIPLTGKMTDEISPFFKITNHDSGLASFSPFGQCWIV